MGTTTKIASLLLCIAITCFCSAGLAVHAETAAENITKHTLISSSDKSIPLMTMLDRNYSTSWTSNIPDTVLQLDGGVDKTIGGLYIKWETVPEHLTFQESSDGISWTSIEPERAHKYLHEYISLPTAARFVQIQATGGTISINEIFALSPGTPPDWVQQWNPSCKKADILFLPTHIDDEDLWFGGALSLYAVQEKKNVQVAYLIHPLKKIRNHEALDSEWHVGIKNYPVFSNFPDSYSMTLAQAEMQNDSNKMIQYQVGLLRRFKPDVVVDQDVNGEYGHGVHILNVKCLMSSLRLSPDPTYDPATVNKYGVWDVPKTYLHIYPKEQIVLNYSTKLPEMENKTPYQLAVEAFKLNVSQQNGLHAVLESGPYDCRKFGLYRTLVGFDIKKNDMFENIGNPTGPAQYADTRGTASEVSSSSTVPSSVPSSSAAVSTQADVSSAEVPSEVSSTEPSSSEQDSSQAGVIQEPTIQSMWIIPVFLLFLAIALSIVMIGKKAVRRRHQIEKHYMQEHKVTYIDEIAENEQHDEIIESIDNDIEAIMQEMPGDESSITENNPQEAQIAETDENPQNNQ